MVYVSQDQVSLLEAKLASRQEDALAKSQELQQLRQHVEDLSAEVFNQKVQLPSHLQDSLG